MAPSSLGEYLEGRMRVPLSLLTSEGFAECPATFSDRASVTEFQQFLNNHDQPITGIVSPQGLDYMLEELEITRSRFRQTLLLEPPCVNRKLTVDCLLGQHCLVQARRLLGDSYECTVRIYVIPPELPGKYSDGEICRQVLLHDNQSGLCRQWLEKLPPGKEKHMSMIFLRPEIWSAMKDMASLPGLWEDIKLGNWAKHLAAHLDELIVAYWRDHMRKIWDDIFEGLGDLERYLDAYTARFLQFKAPAWSKTDRRAIREEMEKGALFPNISNQPQREKLLDKIVKVKTVIPSILTFHENMRYLTMGASILMNHIEVKRRKRRRGKSPAISRPTEGLIESLGKDWTWTGNHMEVEEGRYLTVHEPLDAKRAFLQLILMALRLFPFLGSVPPLQDIKGRGMDAFVDDNYKQRLCMGAFCLGYRNWKISEGLKLSSPEVPRLVPENNSCLDTTPGWRGGMPTINVFRKLKDCSFLPTLKRAVQDHTELEPNPLLIKFDLIQSFFGTMGVHIDQSKPVVDSAMLSRQLTQAEPPSDKMDGIVSHQRRKIHQEPKDLPSGRAPKAQRRLLKDAGAMRSAAASHADARRKDPAETKRLELKSKSQLNKNAKPRVRTQAETLRTLANKEDLESEIDAYRAADTTMVSLPDNLTAPCIQNPILPPAPPDAPGIDASAAQDAALSSSHNRGHEELPGHAQAGPEPGDFYLEEMDEDTELSPPTTKAPVMVAPNLEDEEEEL